MPRIGILHPGQMGSMVALSLQNGGNEVCWASEGRSAATRSRAVELNLTDVDSLAELCGTCAVIVSVCPPEFADEIADRALEHPFRGLYIDANAISPLRARRMAERMGSLGIRFVDGGIVGPAARAPGRTWIYLSGENAAEAAQCFANPLQTKVIGGGAGQASAFKMCYAGYNKGTMALLCAVLASAEHWGVRRLLEDQWATHTSELAPRDAEKIAARAAPRAWRFAPEMREIADTFEAAGAPPEFHRAAAEIFSKLSGFKDAADPDLEEIVRALAPLAAGEGK
ncbi:MAG TPA: DUF1932 domain-containing protein [Bryobacteraceae bacterium]|nr:DUF1932 domain-containing protein [Bryobacteraceae bacterium]